MDLEPKKLLGHEKVDGPGLCAEGKAQRVIIHERAESWIILDVEDKVEYPRSTHSHRKGKALAYSGHGAQVINV